MLSARLTSYPNWLTGISICSFMVTPSYSLRACIVVHQVHLEELCSDTPINVPTRVWISVADLATRDLQVLRQETSDILSTAIAHVPRFPQLNHRSINEWNACLALTPPPSGILGILPIWSMPFGWLGTFVIGELLDEG